MSTVSKTNRRETETDNNEEIGELKRRIELTELRAHDVEAQARLLEAQIRIAEARVKLKSSRATTDKE